VMIEAPDDVTVPPLIVMPVVVQPVPPEIPIVTAPLPLTLDVLLTGKLKVPMAKVPLVTLKVPVTVTLLAVSVMLPPAIVRPPLNAWAALDGV